MEDNDRTWNIMSDTEPYFDGEDVCPLSVETLQQSSKFDFPVPEASVEVTVSLATFV